MSKANLIPGDSAIRIVGLDMAWGERNGDGLCLLEATDRRVRIVATAHVFGDAALLDWLGTHLPPAPAPAMVLFDAPLICPNATGSRPVDRLTHTLFRRFHAGAHPANIARCPRPLRLAAAVEKEPGLRIGWSSPGRRGWRWRRSRIRRPSAGGGCRG